MSIIRDRRLDPVALQYILQQHPHSPIVFVDGWTGKGAIYGELQRSLAQITDKQQQAQLFHQGGGDSTGDVGGSCWVALAIGK